MAAPDVTPDSLRPLAVLARLPDGRRGGGGGGPGPGGVPALPPRAGGRRAEGVPHHGRDAAGDRPPALGARAARDLRRPVAARAARAATRRRRSRPTRRCRSPSSRCSSGSRPSSARSTCCTSCSATPTRRSRRWSARAPANCRQILVRARRHVDAGRPRFEPSRERREALLARFLAAVRAGDVDGLAGLLAADAVHYADGGGKVRATRLPIYGRGEDRAPVGGARRAGGGRLRAAHGRRQRPAGRRRLPPDGDAGHRAHARRRRRPRSQRIRAVVNPDKLARAAGRGAAGPAPGDG